MRNAPSPTARIATRPIQAERLPTDLKPIAEYGSGEEVQTPAKRDTGLLRRALIKTRASLIGSVFLSPQRGDFHSCFAGHALGLCGDALILC